MINQGKLTQSEFEEYMMPMALDMQAVFNLIQEDVFKLIDESIKEGWTPDVLIKKIEELI
jgi:hypothetical protein